MIKICRTCYNLTPHYIEQTSVFHKGTCRYSGRKVLADMTACQYHKERGNDVAIKSNEQKRNKYKDGDGNVMLGMTVPEVLDKTLTILCRREYTWEKYKGLAVKVADNSGNLIIVEITAKLLIKKLCSTKFPDLPVKVMFIERTSKNDRKYFDVTTDVWKE